MVTQRHIVARLARPAGPVRSVRSAGPVVAALFLLSAFQPFNPPAFSAKPGPEVFVVADASEETAGAFLPSPDTPVYYYFVGQKEKAIGSTWAGEKFPPKAAIESEVIKALASQGYHRTQVGGPKPSLVIMALWGTASAEGGGVNESHEDEDGASLIYNQREIKKLLGAHKLNARGNTNPFEYDEVREAMSEDRVYVMLGAFDAGALARKERKLVWRASMSIDTLAHSFPASLATMLASAAPWFGRNTEKALIIDDKVRKGRVEIGEAIVIGTEPANPQPPPPQPPPQQPPPPQPPPQPAPPPPPQQQPKTNNN